MHAETKRVSDDAVQLLPVCVCVCVMRRTEAGKEGSRRERVDGAGQAGHLSVARRVPEVT